MTDDPPSSDARQQAGQAGVPAAGGGRQARPSMPMIGLIGGMSWESSAEYYRLINEGVRDRRGPTVSARCMLWSFDFSEIEALQHEGDWEGLTERMVDAALRLEASGADVLLICTNTMHRMAAAVQAAASRDEM